MVRRPRRRRAKSRLSEFSQTWAQQSDVITQIESQSILRLAQGCSSSLVGLEDVASFISENTAAISAQFEFDDILRSTLLYQAAERSHLRQAIRGKNPKDLDKASTKSAIGRLSRFGLKPAFQAIGPSIKTVVSGNFDAWQGIRVKIRRDLILEPSEKNITAERGSFQENSSRHIRGDSSGTSSGPETGTPTHSLLSGVDYNSTQLRSGLASWRRAFQRRSANTRDGTPATEEDRTTKVLLLGASGGGKSTLLRAMQIFTEAQEPRGDESRLRALVWHNALESVATILREAERLGMTEFTPGARELLSPCSDCERDPAWNLRHAVEVSRTILHLRSNIAFREAVKRRTTDHFHDNSQYYIDNIGRLVEQAAHGSMPTNGDLLRTQVTTTGIHQSVLSYNGTRFCVYDCGGVRAERKKWVRAFEGGVSAIIYPVDTTGYRRSLREAEGNDRMIDQFLLFQALVDSGRFAQSNFIIVFTKIDLLEDYMKDADVAYFCSRVGFVVDHQPDVTTAEGYLYYLQRQFSRLVNPDARERIRFVRANLVDIDEYNPAIEIFNALGGFTQSTRPPTPRPDITSSQNLDALREWYDILQAVERTASDRNLIRHYPRNG